MLCYGHLTVSAFTDGNLLVAYQRYQAACAVLLRFSSKITKPQLLKRVDRASRYINETLLICQARDREAVLKGNLALVCTDVSHGTVIQVCQPLEALPTGVA